MIKARDEAFQFYFHFMEKRMQLFWQRVEGTDISNTDPILSTYKFTNVYRVLDRVSQYLIAKVIYPKDQSFTPEDTLFRILIFKVFNRIETWEFLEQALEEPISLHNFKPALYSELLSYRIKNQPIFSGAYLMTASHRNYQHLSSKHERWLTMIQKEFIQEHTFDRVFNADSMAQVFNILKEKTFIGGFLAYQYAIDFNYSPHLHFDENSFVKAGIGAIRGIKKCFEDFRDYTYEDCIRYTQEHLLAYQEQYGYTEFKNLYNRPPTLIDLQNCFCETDKYLRVQLPELNLGNTRIKQKYKPTRSKINYQFPPKWGIMS